MELNYTILQDIFLAEQAATLDPHFNIPGLYKPYEISGNLGLLAPSTAIVSRYLRDHTEHPESDTISSRLTRVSQ